MKTHIEEIGNTLWDLLKNDFKDVYKSLENCSHHYIKDGKTVTNVYHEEGNVKVHTSLAFDTMIMILEEHEESGMSFGDDIIISALAGIVIHDFGKPFVRKQIDEKERTRFLGHELTSTYMGLNYLLRVSEIFDIFDDECIKDVLSVVATHTSGFKNENINNMLFNKRTEVLFDLVTNADHSGRVAMDVHNDVTIKKEPVNIKKYDDTLGTVNIMVGLPRCGKSTYVKYSGLRAFSPDEELLRIGKENNIYNYNECFNYAVENKLKWVETAKKDLETYITANDKNDVVWDATNLSGKARRGFCRNIKDKYKRKINFIFVIRDFNKVLESATLDEKTIPIMVYTKMVQSFSFPKKEEGDNLEIILVKE